MELSLRLLVAGLGSMGKRRIRNLQALGCGDLAGLDVRHDRRAETAEQYRIPVFDDLDAALSHHEPDAIVISVPPQYHMDYAWRTVDYGLHCFIEASVVHADRIIELARRIEGSGLVVAPSCTMRYFPGPRQVKRLVEVGAIGQPLNISYQTGQYLPDWHPWESISDYYVSARETGGCREIVPFELTWLNDIFGDPEPLACVRTKLTTMEADIDDIYHCVLEYPNRVVANLVVEVISRPNATREMRVLGSEGILVFSADENSVRYCTTGNGKEWTRIPLSHGHVEAGYINPEEPYIAEMSDFLSAVKSPESDPFPNTLEADWRVLQALYRLEELSRGLQ
jgi:predicted dehydrogenase